jgi:hypothetical protein
MCVARFTTTSETANGLDQRTSIEKIDDDRGGSHPRKFLALAMSPRDGRDLMAAGDEDGNQTAADDARRAADKYLQWSHFQTFLPFCGRSKIHRRREGARRLRPRIPSPSSPLARWDSRPRWIRLEPAGSTC